MLFIWALGQGNIALTEALVPFEWSNVFAATVGSYVTCDGVESAQKVLVPDMIVANFVAMLLCLEQS